MSLPLGLDVAQRKSKQQATKNIVNQSRKRTREEEELLNQQSTSSRLLPSSVYGTAEEREGVEVPGVVIVRDMMRNALLKTVSEMYFGTTDPFGEILRSLDDRISANSGRYVSAVETMLRAELLDNAPNNKKAIKEKIIVTPLDMLTCAFRKGETIDKWTPIDITLFELGICENRGYFPKKMLSLFDGKKSVEEMNEFFDQVYSKTESYLKLTSLLENSLKTFSDYDHTGDDSSQTEVIVGLNNS